MTRYRTKPQTVEAVQWRGDNEVEVVQTLGSYWGPYVARFGRSDIWYAVDADDRLASWEPGIFDAKFELVEPREENEGSD